MPGHGHVRARAGTPPRERRGTQDHGAIQSLLVGNSLVPKRVCRSCFRQWAQRHDGDGPGGGARRRQRWNPGGCPGPIQGEVWCGSGCPPRPRSRPQGGKVSTVRGPCRATFLLHRASLPGRNRVPARPSGRLRVRLLDPFPRIRDPAGPLPHSVPPIRGRGPSPVHAMADARARAPGRAGARFRARDPCGPRDRRPGLGTVQGRRPPL